ncbi:MULTISPECIES: LIC_11502 family protein [Leptospira]|uniref:Uncharacterized protein n=8 Tax=Leptospira borgpetersenii TaxID=174 RepID=M3F6H2_LEPBO|nr:MULTISPECIES: hypothetical protein [Leptospira]EMF97557.1 hypothetical protein LEP1GSC123_1542 [Leptospira borgpetersenii str. 200701203]EMO10431.1 hypothetical protein LEP1GSC137_4412 [Leptospira borgpetersenii str. Noumea 25]EMO64247.1 hypothetical protein LEP1GSC133_0895 [Leptospira borgpetersenii serovar Pomona str. 200901868]ABJ76029.1 Hypothetical protein LBJ_1456 [Leptospira borgpetersenii serovar Hardjo-bovis str. JB197]ABJ79130.1 Hypothetical protein LBL_1680 [Leptospira borgpeters
MQKELSERIKFPKTDLELIPDRSPLSYSDVIAAIRLTLLPKDKLAKQIVFASILGALKGFNERDLKPFYINHKYIFSELRSEVLKTIEVTDSIDTIPNENRIKLLKEAFDYGIRKVYHLEWKLYTSREIY